MASIIEKSVDYSKGAWKGGLSSGAITGIAQGVPAMLGAHQFFARLGGGLVSASIVKNPVDKRIILVESVKESLFQLMAGE